MTGSGFCKTAGTVGSRSPMSAIAVVDPRIIAEAHVAISLVANGTNNLDDDPAPICLLQPRIFKLGELWDIASIHRRRLRVAHGYAMIPNRRLHRGCFYLGIHVARVRRGDQPRHVLRLLANRGVDSKPRAPYRRVAQYAASDRGAVDSMPSPRSRFEAEDSCGTRQPSIPRQQPAPTIPVIGPSHDTMNPDQPDEQSPN